MPEQWRTVVGYEGFYEVSSRGRVRSVDHLCSNAQGTYIRRGRILRASPRGSGQGRDHLAVGLYRGSKVQSKQYIHTLVLNAFIGPCPSGMECRHMDGNTHNNHADNLQWGTRHENIADQIRHGTKVRGEKNGSAKLSVDTVRKIRQQFDSDNRYGAIARIARAFGLGYQTTHNVCMGASWRDVA